MSEDPVYSDLIATLFALTGQEGDALVIQRPFVRFTGSLEAGMLLGQLLYWTPRAQVALPGPEGEEEGGWIAKTDEEFAEELCLSRYALRKARQRLEGMGILETRVAKFAGVPTVHYRLDLAALERAWVAWCRGEGVRKNDFSKSKNRSCETGGTYTKTTTETTTPPPTVSNSVEAKGGGGGLPPDVLEGLAVIGYRKDRAALAEVAAVMRDDPERVRRWLAELRAHPEDYRNPAGFFRQQVLRGGGGAAVRWDGGEEGRSGLPPLQRHWLADPARRHRRPLFLYHSPTFQEVTRG
ncbi:MAG TPA: hypothetical protein G4O00_14770 [Thermoflexia bacterium]|nr:hypothetical protein [Thermoflexia bacterium]